MWYLSGQPCLSIPLHEERKAEGGRKRERGREERRKGGEEREGRVKRKGERNEGRDKEQKGTNTSNFLVT